jgi:hypothetical protein
MADPTSGWPDAGPTPALDLDQRAVGPLRLGDPFAAARVFGRPKRLGGSVSDGNLMLEYATFELEFKGGAFICAKFDIDDPSRVVVDGFRLSRSSQPGEVLAWFGEPSSDSGSSGGNFRWIDFERDGATFALEFDRKGLTCVQLYGEGYA